MSDLSDKIKRLKEQTEAQVKDRSKAADHSKLGMTAKEIVGIQKFLTQFLRALIWLWWNVGNPIFNMFTMPIFKWAWRTYRRFWEKFAYYTDKYNTRQFSVRRGAGVIVFTLFCLYAAQEVFLFTRDAGMFVLAHNSNETVYLFHSTDNSFTVSGDDFSVSGCEINDTNAKIAQCNDEDSIYFRVESTAFNNFWSLITKHHFFLPDRVQAPIAPGWNKCVITSYGIRARFAIKTFNIYQELLSTDCQKIS